MAIGFGLVGCGMIARFHARAIADVRGAKLVGCCSSRWESAALFGKEFDVQPFENLNQMLSDDRIHAISICSPSGAHMEPAIAAAKAGKHVIVEKPLEINLRRCDKIIEACHVNKVKLATIFPSRFHQASQLLKSAVDKGKFGTLSLGDAYVKWFRTQEYYDSGNWRGTWNLDGGGALMNQAIHNVDLLSWLMGPVVEVTAKTATLAHERIEVEDVATALLRFENGALGVIEATTAAYPGSLKKIEIHGSHGTACIEEEDIKAWSFAKMTTADKKIASQFQNVTESGGGAADPAAIGHAGHTKQFKDFIGAIKKDTTPFVDGVEGRKSVEIIRAVYRSAKTGKSVQLPLKSDR